MPLSSCRRERLPSGRDQSWRINARIGPSQVARLSERATERTALGRVSCGSVTRDSELGRFLELIGNSVREKRCILFLGAGVHAQPPVDSAFAYPAEHRPPAGEDLSRTLAAACDYAGRFPDEDVRNLQRVGLALELDTSRGYLVDLIANELRRARPSPMLHALAKLDFPVVITTNYDQLLEQSLQSAGKQPRVSIYSPQPQRAMDFRSLTAESPVIYKLHGDIAHPESLVVTDEDYIQFVLRMSDKESENPVPLSLRYYLSDMTTLFVGYSLRDYNLRLLFKTLRWKVDKANLPRMYSVDVRPDPLLLAVWQNEQKHVKFIAQDVWSFVPLLHAAVRGEEFLG